MEKKTRTSLNLVSKIFNLFDYLCTSTFHVIKFLMIRVQDLLCRMIVIWEYLEKLGPFSVFFCLRDVV